MLKKWCLIFLLLIPMIANAAMYSVNRFDDKGVYWLGEVGKGFVNYGFLEEVFGPWRMEDNIGLAGRMAIGYQENRYLAVETGLSAYSSAKRDYNNHRGLFGNLFHSPEVIGKSSVSEIYSVDLMGVLRAPIGQTLYAGLGVGGAFMHFHATNGQETDVSWEAGSKYFLAPKIELRLGAKITPKTSVFISASHVFNVHDSDDTNERNYQYSLDLIGVGMTYQLTSMF